MSKRSAYKELLEQRDVKAKWAVPLVLLILVTLLCCGCIGTIQRADSLQKRSEASAADQEAPVLEVEEPTKPEPALADDVVMTLNGDADTYVLAGEEYLEAGCHAVQTGVGDITKSVQVEGDVDPTTPGDYQVTYTATTDEGAQAQATRQVHVVESLDAAQTLPVLMYHWVYTEDAVPEDADGNYILDTQLAQELQYLNESGYYYPSYEEVRAFVDGTHSLPEKSVVVTFDDGEQGFLDYGIPLLEEYEVPATSFVICSDGDAGYKVNAYASPYVRFQSHSYDMHKAGSNVGKGGVLHALTQEEILEDAQQAEAVLGDVEAMAYPFGDNNETAWAALEDAGVLCAFTVKNAQISPGDNPYALNRVRVSGDYSLDSFKALL